MNTLKIATSYQHWISPFYYKAIDGKNCYLSLNERIFSVALAIFTYCASGILVGIPLSFYLATAYFKNRAINKINTAQYGLSIKARCASSKQEILVHKGFGIHRPLEIIEAEPCPCCHQYNVLTDKVVILDHCKYSLTAKMKEGAMGNAAQKANGKEVEITKKDQIVSAREEMTLTLNQQDQPWDAYGYFIVEVKPIIN